MVSTHDPRLILPSGYLCIKYGLNFPVPCINISDPYTQRMLTSVLKPALVHSMLAYKELVKSDPEAAEKTLSADLRREIASKSEGEPLSLYGGFFGPLYDISNSFGNIVLRDGTSVSYESSRSATVPQKGFLEGSSNVVIPMESGRRLPITPDKFYWFDLNSERMVSKEAENGAVIEIQEPAKTEDP